MVSGPGSRGGWPNCAGACPQEMGGGPKWSPCPPVLTRPPCPLVQHGSSQEEGSSRNLAGAGGSFRLSFLQAIPRSKFQACCRAQSPTIDAVPRGCRQPMSRPGWDRWPTGVHSQGPHGGENPRPPIRSDLCRCLLSREVLALSPVATQSRGLRSSGTAGGGGAGAAGPGKAVPSVCWQACIFQNQCIFLLKKSRCLLRKGGCSCLLWPCF